MKTFLTTCVLGCFLLAGWTIAEPPMGDTPDAPVRLKKKKKTPEKPEATPEKPELKPEKPVDPKQKPKLDEDAGLDPRDVKLPQNDKEDEENEILQRLARNSRLSEEKLAKRETGESTRKLQEEILKDLDRLLEQSKQDQQQGQQGQQGQDSKDGGGGGGGSADQQQGGQGGQGGQAGQGGQGGQTARQRAQQRAQRRQQRSGSRQMAQRQGGSGQANKQGQKPGQGTDGGGNGGNSTEKKDPSNPDKKFDLWGHLPEKERALMNKEMEARFMEKYDELTKQYYRTIAEKSRKK